VLVGGEPLLGVIGDHWSLPVAYRTAAIGLVVTAVPLVFLWLREHRREEASWEEAAEQSDEPQPTQS